MTEEGPPFLERRRLHPNSRGSKRSLERELAAVKDEVAVLCSKFTPYPDLAAS